MTLKIKSNDRRHINQDAALKELTREKTVTLNILLPESVKRNFKLKVTKSNTDMTTVLLRCIREYIETH